MDTTTTRTFESGDPLGHVLQTKSYDNGAGLEITCKNCNVSSKVYVNGETAVYSGNPVTGSFVVDSNFEEFLGLDAMSIMYLDLADNSPLPGAPVEVGEYQATIMVTYNGKYYVAGAPIVIQEAPIVVTFGTETEFTFDETTHTPTYEVTDSEGNVLTEDKDYTVSKSWKDMSGTDAQSKAGYCAGNGKLTITAIGNYDGTDYVEYSVAPAKFEIQGLKNEYEYTGKGVIGRCDYIVVGIDGKELVEGTDFNVSIDDGKAENQTPGKHTIQFISLNQNYESAEFTFTIVKGDTPSPSPKTGDTNNMMLYLIIAVLAAALAASGSVMLKKKSR